MLKIVEQLGVRCPISAFNGATVTTPDLTVISALRLAPDAARETLALLAKTGVDAWVFADDVWLLENPGATSVVRERRAVGFEPVVTTGFEAVIDRIDKIVGVCDDPELLSRVEAEIHATLGGDVNAIRSQAYYLDITHPKADKGAGVLALCAAIGVDAALTAVIGDMANDVAMFRVAGLSIAMGQAPETVKAEADAVTGPNTDDGFARAVETLLLAGATD
jgi:Cof subfamily protein (haloacid dehalogenase superfamily)